MTTTKAARVNPGTPVVIAGKGIVKATGAPVYGATSASEPGRLHLIVWEADRHMWACDCARWHWRHSCRHVAALNVRLARERDTTPRRGPPAFSLLK